MLVVREPLKPVADQDAFDASSGVPYLLEKSVLVMIFAKIHK